MQLLKCPFADWGYLVFFDTEVHRIPTSGLLKTLAVIPKLEAQWKIIYDFKPTEECFQNTRGGSRLLDLGIRGGGGQKAGIYFFPNVDFILTLEAYIHSDEGLPSEHLEPLVEVWCNRITPIGEWTRMEVSHEMEDGEYFLSLSIGGTEVGRKEVTVPAFRDMAEVNVVIGSLMEGRAQPGFIRGLVVLQKE